MQKITLITGNAGKVEEVARYLGFPIDHLVLDLHEIQSLDLEEIVREKAASAYEKIKKPLLVEDVSLVFKAMGNLPGPLVKWFEKELGLEEMARLVDGKDRSCVATVCYGYHDGTNIYLVSGSMAGRVAEHPRGNMSFGWSPVFIPEGMDKTYAELSWEEIEPIAMRRKALEKLQNLLK